MTYTELRYIHALIQQLGWDEDQALRLTNLERCGPIEGFPWPLTRSLTGKLERECAHAGKPLPPPSVPRQGRSRSEGLPASPPSTSRQRAYLRSLLMKASLSEEAVCRMFGTSSLDAIDQRQASRMIDELLIVNGRGNTE